MIYLSRTDFLNFRTQVLNAGPNSKAAITCRNFTLFYNYCWSNEPCSNFSSELSELTFRLSNMSYSIPPAGYLLDNYGPHACAIAVSYISDTYNMYILGDPFIRSFYTAFDYETNQVMLAVNVNAPNGTSIDVG